MPAGTIVLRLATALALIVLNGYFVAVEFAAVASRRTRLEEVAGKGNATARAALRLLENPDRVIAASQLGITLASLALGWVGEATVAAIIEPPLEAVVGRWSAAAAHSASTVVAFALVTFAHIVVGEQTPKTISIRYSETVMLAITRPTAWFIRVFRPLIAFLDKATALVLRVLRVEPIAGHRTIHSSEELRMLVRESQEAGAIEPLQEEMLQKVFQFGDRQVGEVMIPRPEVVGVHKEATVQELLDLFVASSHARFPVYGEGPDDIVGIISIKDVLRAIALDPEQVHGSIGALMRPARFVPETAAVADLFAEMRASHEQMAVVIDEYGGTAGIVTAEELVEEIVGRLSDELVAREEPARLGADGWMDLDAQLRVEEVNEDLELDLPQEEEYETVAGLILYRLQRIPAAGDVVVCAGVELKVSKMRGPKIERVKVRKIGEDWGPPKPSQGNAKPD